MGYAKYFEDNQEIMFSRTAHKRNFNVSHVPVQHFVCPYCNLVEYSQEKLFEHIKNEHNITHPVIVVNGKVINEQEHSVAQIEGLSIFTYGFSDKILLDDETYLYTKAESIDLTREAKELLESNGSFEISVGEKKLKIKKYSVKEVRNDKITPIIRDWESSIVDGIMISMKLPADLNEIEREYLKGLYNYFLACISDGEDKKHRYYEAYTILQEFNPINSLGVCALKVIAFKFNWINSLMHLCEMAQDEFNAVCSFYTEGYKEKLEAIIIDYQNSLYIEDSIIENIDAISNFMFGNLGDVESYLSKIDLEEITDKNLKDRLFVLLREMSLANNNTRKARQYNDKILSPELIRK